MATIKVSEASGVVLDYLVCLANGAHAGLAEIHIRNWCGTGKPYSPSTNWAHGGPIIDRAGITILRADDEYQDEDEVEPKWVTVWVAAIGQQSEGTVYGSQGDSFGTAYTVCSDDATKGATPLIAAMRCYVASKLGEAAVVPDGLSLTA